MEERKKNAIFAKLIKFQNSVESIKKADKAEILTKSGAKFGYDYATLDSIQNAIKKALLEHDLYYYQAINEQQQLFTVLYDSEGETLISDFYPLVLGGLDAQKVGAAITYAKRYQLVAFLALIVEDEDDDATSVVEFQKKNYKTEEVVFLTEDQFMKTLNCNNHFQIQEVLKNFNTFEKKMKKEYREKLEEKLQELINQ